MKILKRITAVTLIFAMAISVLTIQGTAASYKDVDGSAYYAEAVEALTTYGIVSGYAGYYEPNSYVTRAEFSKMIALVSGLDDEVYSKAGTRRFDDVPLSHWANGYVNTAADNQLIVGYPNGSFMPEKKITFAEAVTVLLRAMNYTTADLGDNWPYAYMVKASALGLTDGIKLGDNSYITRGDLAVVIDRALQTAMNGSTQKLISKMDIKVTDEVLVIATKNEDSSLASNEIKTGGGTYTLANTELEFTPLTKVELVLNDDGDVINFKQTYTPKMTVTSVDSYLDGVVYFENGTNSRTLGVTDSTPVYNDGTITNYSTFKNSIEEGVLVSVVYGESGSVDYLLFNTASYTEAVAIRTDIYSALASVGVTREQADNATVIRDGKAATLADAELYDVVYYLADNSTVYIYCDKLSGVYNEAYPNKANVSSVEISGNVLELETQTAAYKLGEKSGSYALKSKITALLGKDGKVVDIVDLNSSDVANYGILLSYSSEISSDISDSGQQYNYITVINGEGNTSKYKTKTNYSERIGRVGKLSFDDEGYATFNSLNSNGANISGTVDKVNGKVGNNWLTRDCVILERVYAPETGTGTAIAQTITLDDIPYSELSAKQVVYAVTAGSFGDISLLIVENVTKSQYTYGILTANNSRASSSSASGSYTIFSGGSSKTYQASFSNNIAVGTPVAMVLDGNSLASLRSMVSVKTGAKLTAIDFTRVKVGNDVYKLGDDVQIFKRNSSGTGYTSISINDAEALVGDTVNIYAESLVSTGGLVRVIVVN